jgi:hypothetical protein
VILTILCFAACYFALRLDLSQTTEQLRRLF